MTQYWEPGTQYNIGDVVEYEGHRYKIVQAHFSQGDWTPPVTPALWGRLQDGDHNSGNQQQQQFSDKPSHQQSQDQHQNENNQHKDQSFKDKAENFYHEHEKEIKIGGGIAAGAALLGAAGLAYNQHQKSQEQGHQQQQQHQQNQQHQDHSRLDDAKSWASDHKKEIGLGALAAGGAAYLINKHKKGDDSD